MKDEERAILYRLLEHGFLCRRRIEVKQEGNAAVLLLRVLTDLEIACVSRCFPIHIPRAVVKIVRANAMELVTASANLRFELAGDFVEKLGETGLWVDGGVNEDLALDCHVSSMLAKSKRKAAAEQEHAVVIQPSLWEEQFHGFTQFCPASNEWKVHSRREPTLRPSGQMNGE
jgi:hypothetical protein